MSHPVVINLGVGRSGTTFIYNAMRERYHDRAFVMHEDLSARRARMRSFFRCYEDDRIAAALSAPRISSWIAKVSDLAETRPVVITGSTTSHLAPVLASVFGSRLRVFHVHRHPLNVCAASYVGPWSTNWTGPATFEQDPNAIVLTPSDPWVRHPHLRSQWHSLGAFGRISYNWLERTAAGLEFAARYPHVPHRLLSAETDVFATDAWVEAIAEFAGLPVRPGGMARNTARNSSWSRSLEERPLGRAWMQLLHLPEVVALAASLGHDCNETELESRARKYQLPPGLGSCLRYLSHYWQGRRHCVSLLRRTGVLPKAELGGSGDDPRATDSAIAETLGHWRGRLRRKSRNSGSIGPEQ